MNNYYQTSIPIDNYKPVVNEEILNKIEAIQNELESLKKLITKKNVEETAYTLVKNDPLKRLRKNTIELYNIIKIKYGYNEIDRQDAFLKETAYQMKIPGVDTWLSMLEERKIVKVNRIITPAGQNRIKSFKFII